MIDLLIVFYREKIATDLPPLSRTSSFSTSVSSRSSTVELLTPTTQPFALPDSEFDDAIGEWVSTVEEYTREIHPSRKRYGSDSDSRGAGKRVKLNDSDTAWSRSLSESPSYLSQSGEREMLDLSAQFDFKLPPVASIGSDLGEGAPVQIDLFNYASWDANELDHSWKLCKSGFSFRLSVE